MKKNDLISIFSDFVGCVIDIAVIIIVIMFLAYAGCSIFYMNDYNEDAIACYVEEYLGEEMDASSLCIYDDTLCYKVIDYNYYINAETHYYKANIINLVYRFGGQYTWTILDSIGII